MRLSELSEKIGTTLEGDGNVEIERVAPVDEAGPGDLAFVANPKYARFLATTKAAAVIVGADVEAEGLNLLRAEIPYAAFVAALALFDRRPKTAPGVHPTAIVGEGSTIGEGAHVGPYAVVGAGVTIGEGAVIHPHAVIYDGVTIGDRATIHAGAVVRECVELGNDIVLQPGSVIGGDGFGYLPTGGMPVPIPQIGGVELADQVEVGANATIDRAAIGATRLGPGVKVDNLVMVAHGCQVGEASMLAGQVGMAGSTVIGKHVVAGGQAGLAGHLSVGDGAQLAAQAGVIGNIEAGTTVAGLPAGDIAGWRRSAAALRRLPELLKRVRRLEKDAGID